MLTRIPFYLCIAITLITQSASLLKLRQAEYGWQARSRVLIRIGPNSNIHGLRVEDGWVQVTGPYVNVMESQFCCNVLNMRGDNMVVNGNLFQEISSGQPMLRGEMNGSTVSNNTFKRVPEPTFQLGPPAEPMPEPERAEPHLLRASFIPPAPSGSHSARMYLDPDSNKLMLSINGSPYEEVKGTCEQLSMIRQMLGVKAKL